MDSCSPENHLSRAQKHLDEAQVGNQGFSYSSQLPHTGIRESKLGKHQLCVSAESCSSWASMNDLLAMSILYICRCPTGPRCSTRILSTCFPSICYNSLT
ncbi:hypothetical protein HAX54_049666 [Datura stramonium]|uniref:Uncharacterized protein n=1 Tax=Datura stramonium TaxID=4076 RepID=A0ABS8SV87_DATST|nr:hypothetical protein [Datura stramonium]